MVDFFGRQAKRELEIIENNVRGKVFLSAEDYKEMVERSTRFKVLTRAGLKELEFYKKIFPSDRCHSEKPSLNISVKDLDNVRIVLNE